MSSFKGWHALLLAGTLGLLFIFYQGLWGNPNFIPPVLIATPAPEVNGPDLYKGTPVSLSDHKGKVILINFWASWCQECKLEHKSLLAIKKHYEDDANFAMFGINYQDKDHLAKDYLEVHGNNFDHIRDLDGKISIDFGVYGVPETFVIDQEGIIRHKQIGPIIGDVYSDMIKKVIDPLLHGTMGTAETVSSS
jgi:cytochrome c biogenesis protein CcmG/thiol:disulfide interchange protein DsbE